MNLYQLIHDELEEAVETIAEEYGADITIQSENYIKKLAKNMSNTLSDYEDICDEEDYEFDFGFNFDDE